MRALAVAALASALALCGAPAAGAEAQAPAPIGAVSIAGREQTVFDWGRDACRPAEEPDLPARAFRDYRGRVQLLLSSYVNFRLLGRSLDRLRRDCRPVLRSPEDPLPQRFEDREWLASLYTTDGRDVWALVHDEYQGNRHPGRCPQGAYLPCWYNAVTLARSTDGGRSYTQAAAPRQLVAASTRPYEPGAGPSGAFAPSNIVTGPDGAHYAFVRVRGAGYQRGACLLRTTRVGSPSSWRAWDGSGFTGAFADPYGSPAAAPACTPVEPGLIAEMDESLTYNATLRRYLLVGLAPPGPLSVGAKVTGIYFSTSRDLLHWTPRTLVAPASSKSSYVCGGPEPIAYPSVIDPASRSRTFATSASRPYLYFTRLHYSGCRLTPQRELVRVRLKVALR